jgi:hypothetical protein
MKKRTNQGYISVQQDPHHQQRVFLLKRFRILPIRSLLAVDEQMNGAMRDSKKGTKKGRVRG